MGKRLSQLNLTKQIHDEDYLLIDGMTFSESKKIKISAILNYIISHIGGNSDKELDTTLTKQGKAAEAKAVGDKINSVQQSINEQIVQLDNELQIVSNKPTGTIVKLITWGEGE